MAFASFVAILIFLSLPGHWIAFLLSQISLCWPSHSSDLISSNFPTDKLIHALLFAICAALFVRGWTSFRKRWWIVCLILFLNGVATELIQRVVPGRSATIGDLLADGLGVIVGVSVALIYLRGRVE